MYSMRRQVFVLFTYCLIGLNLILITRGLVWLELTNDGPAILDSTINFYAMLQGDDLNDNYMFVFQDNAVDHQPPKKVFCGVNCTYSIHLPKTTYRKGNFTMQVTVFTTDMIIFSEAIASKNTTFLLTEFINGNLVAFKGRKMEPGSVFPIGESVNLTLNIYDPNKFFQNATLLYVWKVNDDVESYKPVLQCKFSKLGQVKVALTLVAQFLQSDENSQDIKWGFFEKDFQIKDYIPRINVTGDTWIPHGKMLDLYVRCNGSSPFHYCWKIYPGTEPEVNFTCDYPRVSNSCQFEVHQYIAVIGQYYFSISVSNDVSVQRKSLDVRIYDTSHVPQLSVTVIPITCVVLAIIIIMVGVTYYLHQRKQYVIEVADFDFAESEEMAEKTFFSRVYDAIKNKMTYARQQSPIRNSVNNEGAPTNYGATSKSSTPLVSNPVLPSC